MPHRLGIPVLVDITEYLDVIMANPDQQRLEPAVPGNRSRWGVVRLRRGFSNHERLIVLLCESCEFVPCGFLNIPAFFIAPSEPTYLHPVDIIAPPIPG